MKRVSYVISVLVSLLVVLRVQAVTVFTVEGDDTKMIITTATCQELKDSGVKVDRCVETPRADVRNGLDGYWADPNRPRDIGLPVLVRDAGGFTVTARGDRERVASVDIDAIAAEAEFAWGDIVSPYIRAGAGRADVLANARYRFEGDSTFFTVGGGLRYRPELSPWSAFADYRYLAMDDAGRYRVNSEVATTFEHEMHEFTAGFRYAVLANRLAAVTGVRATRSNTHIDTAIGPYSASTDVDFDRMDAVMGTELQIARPISARLEIATGSGETKGTLSVSYRLGHRSPQRPPALSTAIMQGIVATADGKPVSGVAITAGSATSISDGEGRFRIDVPRQVRTVVSFGHPEFMNTIRVVDTTHSPAIIGVIIWPRAAAVSIDATAGGFVPFVAGGGVRIPPDSLVTRSGRPVAGKADIRLTLLDVSDRGQLRGVPGDFTARMRDGRTAVLESFGVFEITGTANGEAVDFRPGTRALVEVPVPERIRPRATQQSTLFSFDPRSGVWVEEGEAVFSGSAYNGWITTFDTAWNVDNPLDTTCIHAQVIRVFPTTGPVAGALVTATGVSYTGISNAVTDAQGYACLLVKINAVVDIEAFVNNFSLGVQQVNTPNVAAGAAQCPLFGLCPVVGVPFEKDW